jgi:N-acetylmuramoyl-L-alanine amidase
MIKFLSILLLTSSVANAYVVLIDPGHGGQELGAVHTETKINSKGKKYKKHIYEKDLALKLAKAVKKYLSKSYTTYLTRSIDRTVTLNERADLADTVKADLFISIHFNSSTSKKSHGFETYFLHNHKDLAVKKVERIENKYLKGAEKIVNQILIDLVIKKTATSSKSLANSVHSKIAKNTAKKYNLTDRGIKPGLFYVLALSKRPGILIEAGFISNQDEMDKIESNSYIKSYAKAIAEGIKEYLKKQPIKDLPLF